MSFIIQVSDDKSYIIIVVKGGQTNQTAMEQNIEAHTLGNSLGISRYLVDLRASNYEGTAIDHYQFTNSEIKVSKVINRLARVAMLVGPEDHSHDFMETVARNTGLDVTLFRDRDQAINHLIYDL